MANPALHLNSVSKTFNAEQWNEIKAIRDVSLQFFWGESVLVIGENGSGKSTLLNLIDGTVDLTCGSVEIGGTDVSSWPVYRRFRHIHRVYQDPSKGMAPYGTVAENLAVLDLERPSLFNIDRPANKENLAHFSEAIAAISPDLKSKLSHKVYLLSPGQRQAVALAMLALRNGGKRVLLADEPTAALDPHTAQICLSLIEKKANSGWLVLHVTHNSAIINTHRGRIVTMSEGKVLSDV